MIKSQIINAGLSTALAKARHKDAIVICDANMPIPSGCVEIDVSLIRGVPTLLQTMKAILSDFVAESYQVFELMPQYNPEMYQTIQSLLPQMEESLICQSDLMTLMPQAKAVVRTGDFGSCCTVVLYSASGMDKYVKKYNCNFSERDD